MESTASNVAVVAFFIVMWGLIAFAMYRGWKRKSANQQAWIGELPAVPKKLGTPRVEQATGLYIGTAFAENWQARVAASGLGARANATLVGYPDGVVLERDGSEPLWIPRTAIIEVRTDRRLAGKAMTEDGLLVIRWHPPGSNDETIQIDSGFRGDDKAVYPRWIQEFDSSNAQGRKASE
ncbi:PH-like domain-containing protein [Tomitella biformata]|uniref:PH-like domain-containing protein n=1 Tax=Tomitella biformata TaxID=630403 RepID=UPI0004631549|nr:hypothetical protein [Tomitella biformata]